MAKSRAVEARYAAVKHLTGTFYQVLLAGVDIEKGWRNEDCTNLPKMFAERATLAKLIRSQAALGRTERWKTAIHNWAYMVETADTPATYSWAFQQYSIYAGHAAE